MGLLYFWVSLHVLLVISAYCLPQQLRFTPDGHFKILQIADMHYADGGSTKCEDVLPKEYESCSDLNTTAFVERLIAAEKPDLIVFSGDNIFGQDASDPRGSMNAAFAPAIKTRIPWAAILGNHDQESTLSRFEVMKHIANMEHTLSRVYPMKSDVDEDGDDMTEVDGFGNYHLGVRGAMGSPFENQSVLNLYLLDSGDYSKLPKVHGYGWIQESQKKWFKELSAHLKDEIRRNELLSARNITIPALVYFHMPLIETRHVMRMCSITGVKQESIGCAQVNSGFLNTMREAGNPHVVFNGHDHVNDFCGDLPGNVKMCYGGGVGYHAYGKAGWSRRARIVDVSLQKNWREMVVGNASMKAMNESKMMAQHPQWLEVDQIATWKRLDRPPLLPATIDHEVLWSRRLSLPQGDQNQGWMNASLIAIVMIYLLLCFIFFSWCRPCECTLFSLLSPLRRRLHVGYTISKSYSHSLSEFHSFL